LRITFQADADLDPDIARGSRRREPSLDFRNAAGIIPDGTPDAKVLGVAADAGRVSMRVHFQRFVAEREFPGVLLIPSSRSTGAAIEGILMLASLRR
jgi:hypothetical protein